MPEHWLQVEPCLSVLLRWGGESTDQVPVCKVLDSLAMWNVIYLGLANFLVGLIASAWIRWRARWVRQQLDQGVDFQAGRRSGWISRLLHRQPPKVDLEALCQELDSECQVRQELPWLSNEEGPRSSAIAGDTAEEESQGPAVGEFAQGEEARIPEVEAIGSQSPPIGRRTANSKTKKRGRPESTMEVIDLQSSNESEIGEMDAVVPEVGSGRVDELDAVGVDASNTPDGEHREDQADDESSALVPDFSLDVGDERQKGDFLQQISEIESLLQLSLDDNVDAPNIVEPAAQMMEAACYWEVFRDTSRQILEHRSQAGVSDMLDDLLDEVNQQVDACREIARQGVEHKTVAPESLSEMRDRLLRAATGSHRLRDQLAMTIPSPGLRFQPVHDDMPDYFEGLAGLKEVLTHWSEASIEGEVAGLGLLDLDGCSKINDKFGLELGDRVLVECSRLIYRAIRHNRGYDRLVRIGGQKFLVFLGHTEGSRVCFALERMRQLFSQTRLMLRGDAMHLELKGVAATYTPGEDILTQLKALKDGLENVRSNPDNSVLFYDPTGSPSHYQVPENLPEYDLPAQAIEIREKALA